jgi:CBS domain-containing protein
MDRIRDIMQTDLITVPPEMAVGELASVLDRAGITGAPVVDAAGKLLGIVTVRDVMRLARELSEVPEAARWGLGVPLAVDATGQIDLPAEGEFFAYFVTPGGGFIDLRDRIRELPEGALGGYEVRDLMSTDPVSVPPGLKVAELARVLVDQKIHRALVVDQGKLVGIVTATDVLRSVAG